MLDLFAEETDAAEHRTVADSGSASEADPAQAFIADLRRQFPGRIMAERIEPARLGRYADLPDACHPCLREALQRHGMTRLYSHQREAWERVTAGEDLVIATPTASGKSLCYNLPVLDAVLSRGAKALYLFPTKALAQDQVAELLALNKIGDLQVRASTFDGDTPADARRAVRVHGDIVITNPDMLHQSILPHHTKWAQLFENLAFVVIDELHIYRGVFGAHVANLLRRLRRILTFYGAEPRFITCSATIGNPAGLASELLGAPVHAITDSGAPMGARHLLLWNPPVVNSALALRGSARSQSCLIAREAIERGLKTIVFANSRLEVEVLTKYLKDVFDPDPRKAARIVAYRGGYLPTERHAIEANLRAGRVDALVSTSALELGIDIGALDVCILNGYPGSVASARQRFGRAGRRGRSAVGIMVASSQLIDQYVATHPEFFLDAGAEQAHLDAEQMLVQMEHLRCAAFELAFHDDDHFGEQALAPRMNYLASEAVVHREGSHWHWIADSYPANSVSLRSVADGNFTVIDTTSGGKAVIAEVDYSAAAMTLYEGAIYMVQSAPWQVERLDWVGRKAFVRRTRVDYYTDAIDYTRLKVLDCFEQASAGAGHCQHGEVHVVRRVSGYKKIRYYTHENVGYGPVNLPDQEMHTFALWWDLPVELVDREFPDRQLAIDGLIGAAYTLQHIAALLSMNTARDIGRAVGDGSGTWASRSPRMPSAGAGGTPSLASDSGASVSGASVSVTSASVTSAGVTSDSVTPDSAATRDAQRAAAGQFQPTIFLYDNMPGGSGTTPPLYDRREELVNHALSRIMECDCPQGCPACVGPVLSLPNGMQARATDQTHWNPRTAARRILELLHSFNPATPPAS